MKIKNLILTIILSIFYPFSLLPKVKNDRITFISLESSKLTRDFKIISQALEKSGKYDLKYDLFEYTPGIKNQLAYVITCIKQLFAINSSHLVLLDFNNFVVSKFKRTNGVKVLQLWHATGAIKQFGNNVKRDYKIQNYDYAIANSEFFVETFAEAFNVKKENVKITGIPETDKLFDKKRVKQNVAYMLKKYPKIKNKTIVTYAPTFRGRFGTGFREVEIDLDFIQKSLGESYAIIYKPHPLISNSKYQDNKNIFYMQEESIKKVFAVTDILVSDYSAIVYDYMVTQKPIIAYVPDLAEYSNSPGLLFDYEKYFPGRITVDNQTLIDEIRFVSRDAARQKKLYHNVFKYKDGKSTRRVIRLIENIMADAL
ncbi:CDP-glycerol glycerophosphotransferase family protein [Lactococcus insecticola]|uniref:Teichoic acid biosynthesis protein B n=1 Tax=Pseudolactococcus insecticola TaxID=2709158 RepID=A0A6A0B5L1_9LACT|nr:CDP-glycerol glycerophosphotransferase family protein [Lactococcus insecticola]GFH39798.1 teichoic acid biosynthesis protein B [Lactococcus insecticola]